MVGVAAEQRTAVTLCIVTEAGGEGCDPRPIGSRGQRQRQQKTERLCALCRQIRKVHAQRLAADAVRRIVRKEMYAGNDAVGCQDQIASGRRRQHGGVIDQTQRARMGRERTQIACDQAFLGGFR